MPVYEFDVELGLHGRGDKHARHHVTQAVQSNAAVDSDELATEMNEFVAALRAGATEEVHFILVRAKQIHILKSSAAYKDHRSIELAGVGARNVPAPVANADGTVPSPLLLDGHVLRLGKEAKKNRPGMMSLRGFLLMIDVEGDPAGGYQLKDAAPFTGAGKLIPLLNAGTEATKGAGQGYAIASGPRYGNGGTVRMISHFDIEGVGRLQETHGHTSAQQARENGLIKAVLADVREVVDLVGDNGDPANLNATDATIYNALKTRFGKDWAALDVDAQNKIKDKIPPYLLA